MSKPSDFSSEKLRRNYDIGVRMGKDRFLSLNKLSFELFRGRSTCIYADNRLAWMKGKQEDYCMKWLKTRFAMIEMTYEGPNMEYTGNIDDNIAVLGKNK